MSRHHSFLSQKETMWRQKSRVQWLKEGDRNTRFFHQATVVRRHRNHIRAMRSSKGSQVEDVDEVRRVLFSFFHSRWARPREEPSLFHSPLPDILVSMEENGGLLSPFSIEEVRAVLWSMEEDKAPGPDGFPPLFFRRYWCIIWRKVVSAVQEFFVLDHMPDSWKHAFVTLVPKYLDASEVMMGTLSRSQPIQISVPVQHES